MSDDILLNYYDANGAYSPTDGAAPAGRGQQRETPGDPRCDAPANNYSGVRAEVQRQIDSALDLFANQIPGGGLTVEQAKAEAARILDRMQHAGDERLDPTRDAQRDEPI